MPTAAFLGLILAVAELGIGAVKRARLGEVANADRGTLRILWGVILAAIAVANGLARAAPAFGFGVPTAVMAAAVAVFAAGLVLRAYAIVYLGRFFTVSVAIAADHRVIDTGPYRYVRHPSYTGILLEFFGMGVAFGNWASLAALMLPVTGAFLWRIRVEEAALTQALGERYRAYVKHTRRLLPGVY